MDVTNENKPGSPAAGAVAVVAWKVPADIRAAGGGRMADPKISCV